jgi:hypothetical protein
MVFPSSILLPDAKAKPGQSVVIDPANANGASSADQNLVGPSCIGMQIIAGDAHARDADDPDIVTDT